ncbi:MAG: HU family DNA-binding protein [Bacteroidaceae bacterium]|nr:HU family DNA-binding protein [Bacteroidaceae bacterium]
MDNKINFQQLVEKFVQASGMSRNWSEQFVRSFFDIISEKVIEEGLVKVKGLGTFKLVETENRESVNVNTGERIVIEGHQKINFIPEAELKDFINQPFASFDTINLTDNQLDELAKIEKEEQQNKSQSSRPQEAVPADVPKQTESADSEIARKVAAVKAMGKEAMAKEAMAREDMEKQLQETSEASEESVPSVSTKPLPQKSPDGVVIGPILPAGGTHDREVRHLPPVLAAGLKILAWVLSVIVALWVIVYAVWPAVAVAIFSDMETERKYSQASAIRQKMEYEQLMSLYEDSVQADADTVTANSAAVGGHQPDTVAEPVPEPEPVVKPASKQVQPASTVPSGKLVLLEADEKRDLSEFSASDTVNYRIAGLLAEHVVASGETLSRLSLKYYGTKKLWPYIACFNGGSTNMIDVGDVIRIPVIVNR